VQETYQGKETWRWPRAGTGCLVGEKGKCPTRGIVRSRGGGLDEIKETSKTEEVFLWVPKQVQDKVTKEGSAVWMSKAGVEARLGFQRSHSHRRLILKR
jgi:hypothetical protein